MDSDIDKFMVVVFLIIPIMMIFIKRIIQSRFNVLRKGGFSSKAYESVIVFMILIFNIYFVFNYYKD